MIDFACKKIDMKDLIKCSLGLSKSDYRLFDFMLYADDSYTVKAMAGKLGVDRTTLQKAIKKLVNAKIINQFQENLSPGGYRFLYRMKEKEIIKKRILEIVNNWTEKVNNEVENW